MILEDAILKRIILSALILPLFFLAACGKELSNEEVLQNLTTRSASLQSYHQLVSLKTTTDKEALTNTSESTEQYSVSDASIFPEKKTSYGKRINKKTDQPTEKLEIYITEDVGYIQTDDGTLTQLATPDIPLRSLEIYPLETFIQLAKIVAENGDMVRNGDAYVLTFKGKGETINKEINALFESFPSEQTTYDIRIILDAKSFYLESMTYTSVVSLPDQKTTVTQQLNGEFDLYDSVRLDKDVPVLPAFDVPSELSDSSLMK